MKRGSIPFRYLSAREVAYLTLGSILYAFSMPGENISLWWASYIALIPLFFCLGSENDKWKAATYGLFFGTVSSFILLNWIKFTVSVYGNLGNFVGYIASLFLSIYCGIYFSLFAFLTAQIVKRYGRHALWGAPFFWAGIDLLRFKLKIGFPWLLFGYSQYGDFYSRQFAAYGGVLGTGFVLVLINVLFFFTLASLIDGFKKKSALYFILGTGALLFLRIPGYLETMGSNSVEDEAPPLVVSVVQPNIDQWKKWDEEFRSETIEILRNYTEEHIRKEVDLVVWPETALPFFYALEEGPTDEINLIVKRLNRPVVTGVPWFEDEGDGKYYNSIILISPAGYLVERYNKMKLVPFGEYVPFRKVLFFVDKLTEGAEDFSRGERVKLLNWKGVSIIPTVCYEAIYPQLSIDGVILGGTLLINVTNDAWFGDTPAPYQQLYMAAYRSVETGRYMIRCSNSGITAVVDPRGEVVKSIGLFKRGGFSAQVRLLSGMTFYVINAKFIHLFVISGSIILIGGIILGRLKNGRNI